MKTLYLTDTNTNIVVDTENQTAERLTAESRYDIRDVYVIPEPMHVVYGNSTCKEEADVNQGDILIRFYDKSIEGIKNIIVVSNKDWSDRVAKVLELEQREKEEWAKKELNQARKADN